MMTLTQKFQAILDSRHLNVTGGYCGNHEVKVEGLPADVDEARRILTCMFHENQIIDYDAEGDLPALRIAIFDVPTITDERAVYESAVATARTRGLD